MTDGVDDVWGTAILNAVAKARKLMDSPLKPYAAIVGYKNLKTGDVKLLKDIHMFSNQESFEHMEGIRGHYCIGLVRE